MSAMLDILTFALCVPYSETTDGTHFDTLLAMVAKRGRYLFQLFQVNIFIQKVILYIKNDFNYLFRLLYN